MGIVTENPKTCAKCLLPQEQSNFRISSRGKIIPHCKGCLSEYRKKYYLENRTRILDANKNWSLQNPDNVRERSARWYRENTQRHHALMAVNHEKNKISRNEQHREWYAQNKEKRLRVIQLWRKKNPDKTKAAFRRYRCRHPDLSKRIQFERRQAQPKWLTAAQLAEIRAFYEAARLLTLATGEPHEVDHIVPIKGRNVCGLHVPWNLQILTRSENARKHNSHC